MCLRKWFLVLALPSEISSRQLPVLPKSFFLCCTQCKFRKKHRKWISIQNFACQNFDGEQRHLAYLSRNKKNVRWHCVCDLQLSFEMHTQAMKCTNTYIKPDYYILLLLLVQLTIIWQGFWNCNAFKLAQ